MLVRVGVMFCDFGIRGCGFLQSSSFWLTGTHSRSRMKGTLKGLLDYATRFPSICSVNGGEVARGEIWLIVLGSFYMDYNAIIVLGLFCEFGCIL